MDFTRLFEILEYQHLRYPQKAAAAGREADTWRQWSTEELLLERDRMSAGLLELGLRPEDRIGILAHCGSPQWVIADAAMLQVGMVPVPIHSTCREDEIAHISRDAGLRACFVSNAEMLEKFIAAGASSELILTFGEGANVTNPVTGRVLGWSSVLCEPDEQQAEKIRYYRDGIRPEQLATLLYTSGTTGLPKGVMLSHKNIVSNVKSVLAIVPVNRQSRVVSFLPMSHIFERMVTYTYQASGASLWFADSIERLPKTLQEVRPVFFTAVPRVLERMYERLLEERNKGGQLKRKIIDWAIALGERFPYSGEQAMPLDYYFKQILADFLVFRHWRNSIYRCRSCSITTSPRSLVFSSQHRRARRLWPHRDQSGIGVQSI
jgi:long-chain acyl-CoA synthetase